VLVRELAQLAAMQLDNARSHTQLHLAVRDRNELFALASHDLKGRLRLFSSKRESSRHSF
jgi:hypothetical protein